MNKINNFRFIAMGVFSFVIMCFLISFCFPMNAQAEEMNYYYERVDVSQYLDKPFQLIVDNGLIEEARFVNADGVTDKSLTGDFHYGYRRYYTNTIMSGLLESSKFQNRQRILEIKIKASSNNYSIKMYDGGVSYPFHFEKINLSEGNQLSLTIFGDKEKSIYTKVRLEKGEKYFYYSNADNIKILDIRGNTMVTNTKASNLSVYQGKVFIAPESGIYTFLQKNNVAHSINLDVYKIFPNTEIHQIEKIDFNKPYVSFERNYALENNLNNSFLLSLNNNHLLNPSSEMQNLASFKVRDFKKNKTLSILINVKDYIEERSKNVSPEILKDMENKKIIYHTTTPETVVSIFSTTFNYSNIIQPFDFSMTGELFNSNIGTKSKAEIQKLKVEDREESEIGDPVDAFRGNFVDTKNLLSYSGDNPLAFIMNYDSIANDSKDLSSGFVHNFETRLERKNDELSIYWNPNAIARFTKKDNIWTYNNASSSDITVEENENGYKISEKENTYLFNGNGQIISKKTLNGNVLNYEYENNLLKKVTNERGQTFNFVYENNKLKNVSDVAGREITFIYNDTFTELNKIIYPNKKELIFQYDYNTKTNGSFPKLSLIKFDNVVLVENFYNELGAVSYQYDGNGNKTNYFYDEWTDEKTITTTLTNPDGTTLSKTHNELGQVIKEKNERGFERTFEYDSEGNKTKETDYKGESVLYEYENGNVTKKINPDGTFVLYEYNDYGSITKMTDVDGLDWLYKYNDKNQLIETIDKKGLKTEFEYDSLGHVVNQKTVERVLKRTYDDKGNLIGIELPNSKKSRHEYDALGRQTATILEDGKRFETVYDVQNNITNQIQPDGTSVSYEYDGFGKKIKEIDEMGRTKTFVYDANGNLKSENQGLRGKSYSYDKMNRLTSEETLGKSYSKNYKYDEVGNLIEEKDESDITIKRTYDANNRLLTESNAGDEVQFVYDNMGRTTSKKDAEGNVTAYTYNDSGLLSSEKSPNGYVTKYEYDEVGRPTKTIDPKGHEYLTEYNGYGDKVKETNPLGKSTIYGYDNNGQLDYVVNPLGEITRNIYNTAGQIIEQKNALDETVSKMKYNASGRVIEIEDGNGNTSRMVYDLAGNILETYNGEGTLVAKNEYNEFDEVIKTTNALNQSQLLEYNLLGLQTKMTDGLGNVTTYSYRSNDSLYSSTDANGTTSYNGYDLKGRLNKNSISEFENNYIFNKNDQIIQEDIQGNNSLYYSYNNEGDLSGRKNARGDSSSYEYDENGNLIKETTKEGIITHSYDKLNRKIKSESNEGVITREYDDLNRVIKKTENGKEIGYEYDKRGHLISIVYPDGKTVRYTYDVVGNMLTVTDWKNNVTTYSYNKNNQLVKTIHSNGVVETRDYNVAGQMITLKSVKDDVVITHISYEYDANGNIKKEIDVKNNRENIYTYDKLGRLTNANKNSYTYSSTGNITSYQINRDGQPTISRTMSYNSDNQLSKVGSDLSTIDKDGNLLTYKLNGKTYVATYDSKNKLVQYGNMYYQYDSEGNRIGIRKTGNLGETTESTSFVVDNDSNRLSRILVETKGGKDTYYVYGLGLISEHKEEKVNTYHFDYRGSTTAMTNENGVIIGEAEYDEYGQVLKSTIVTRFMYNGKHGVENDENGLYYMRTRYYNLDLKKFMNRDTVVGNILESQSLNRYAFVNGNPINFTDPFGMSRETVENTKSNWLDYVQTGLDVLGLFPVVGEFADGANVIIYLTRGQYINALISTGSMVPFLGWGATGGKLYSKVSGKLIKSKEWVTKHATNGWDFLKKSSSNVFGWAKNKVDKILDARIPTGQAYEMAGVGRHDSDMSLREGYQLFSSKLSPSKAKREKINAYKGIDISEIEDKFLARGDYIVEMEFLGKGAKKANAEGYLRDNKYFWKKMLENNPELFSEKNKEIISRGRAPKNDAQFRKYMSEFDEPELYDNTLIHHHIGGTGQAMPIPQNLHKGFGGVHNVEKKMGLWK